MRRVVDVLEIVCCPNCQGDLMRLGTGDERLEMGDRRLEIGYVCKSCKSEFREKEGILILISKELEDELRS